MKLRKQKIAIILTVMIGVASITQPAYAVGPACNAMTHGNMGLRGTIINVLNCIAESVTDAFDAGVEWWRAPALGGNNQPVVESASQKLSARSRQPVAAITNPRRKLAA